MGFFSKAISKLSGALAKTREVFAGGLKSLILGRKLDETLIADVERMLLEADVGVKATATLIDGVRADYKNGTLKDAADLLDHLKRGLKQMLASGSTDLRAVNRGTDPGRAVPLNKPHVILVTGVNGAGKTTSIAKLTKLHRDAGRTVLLAACDTFRAGAVKQLEIWAERLGVEVIKGQQGGGGDPAAVAFDACKAALARNVDVLIVDTAGRLQTQDPLMKQLEKIRGVIAKNFPASTSSPQGPHETLLVLDATTGQNALRQAQEFAKTAGVTGIILTKLDGTAKGGVVVAIRAATDIPVKYIGTGERPEDFEPFDAEAFVEALFAE